MKRVPSSLPAALCAVLTVLASLLVAPSAAAADEQLVTIGLDVVSASDSSATYALSVANPGAVDARDVSVFDTVPDHATFSSSDPAPGGGCDNGGLPEMAGTKCSWELGTLAPGTTLTITLTFDLLREDTTYQVDNSALAKSGTLEVPDLDSSLVRAKVATGDDAFVSDLEPVDTDHGVCGLLRVSGDGTTSSFLDIEPLPAEATIDRLWSADLRLVVESTTASTEAPHQVGLFPITSGEWAEGAGACNNDTKGTETQARSGFKPNSADAPLATLSVSSPDQTIDVDVMTALDSTEERGANQGWSLRSLAPGGEVSQFDSTESPSPAQAPSLILVYSQKEEATCIDVDGDAISVHPSSEQVLTATVTDGARISAGSADGCTGAPVPDSEVVWTIETQGADAYVSNAGGEVKEKDSTTAADIAPNSATTKTDGSGVTFAGISLANAAAEGVDRISGRVGGAADAPEAGSDPKCGLPEPAGFPCTGESDAEDDSTISWSLNAPPATTPPTSEPVPSSSEPPSGTPSNEGVERSVTIAPSLSKVPFQGKATISGIVESAQKPCESAGMGIVIGGRTHGNDETDELGRVSTDSKGEFEIVVQVRANVDVMATVEQDDLCAIASSVPVTLYSVPVVTVKFRQEEVARGDSIDIAGEIKPAKPGSRVVLQVQGKKGWTKLLATRVGKRSNYAFELAARWVGPKTFRVRWAVGDVTHIPTSSKTFTIEVPKEES